MSEIDLDTDILVDGVRKRGHEAFPTPEAYQRFLDQRALDELAALPDLAAYARDKRWRVEIGGITIGGVPVATDDRAKIMIVGARVAAEADPNWSTVWQGTDGNGYPINAGQMVAISDAVQEHVNSTFATLVEVLGQIDAGAITDKTGVDAAFA